VELLQLAAMHGLGDIDLELGSGLLEDVRWDVGEAFSRMCGGNPSTAASAAEAAAAAGVAATGLRRGMGSPAPPSHHRALQRRAREEMDRLLTDEDSSERPMLDRLQLPSELTSNVNLGLEPMPRRRDRRNRTHGSSEIARDYGEFDESAADEALLLWLQSTGVPLHAIEALDYIHHTVEEALAEADLQDAMRLSSEEAYSGGFSVPPVDEATLQRMTKTALFCSSDAPGQCSICLMDFENGDSLRTMECSHRFHMACVDQWLAQSGQCPVCKKQVGTDK
jgi:hypothetical protein